MRIPFPLFASILAPSVAIAAAPAGPGQLSVYSEVVAPIFESKCVSCHGEEKVKGKLRMDSFAALMKGGTSGSSIDPGDEESELIYRIITDDEDDHMPPANKPQLTPDEIEVIKWWIVQGADEKKKVSELAPDAAMLAHLKAAVATAATAAVAEAAPQKTEDKAAKKARAEEVTAIAAAVSKELGVPVLPIASGEDKVQFNAVNVTKTFGDAELSKLAPLSGALEELNLARTQVTDSGLETLGKMKGIKRLRLENTSVGDAGIAHLAGLGGLEYLNLYNTGVTDAGIASLAELKGLKKLFVWQTGVTREAAEKLASQVPGLSINLGWDNEVPGEAPAEKGAAENPAPAKES